MVQEAIITKLMPDGMAEVAVVRATACGKSCSSCESCIFQNELKVLAFNLISSSPGRKVLIESKTSSIFSAAAIVYILPVILMVLAYTIAFFAGAGEGLCISACFIGLFIGLALMVIYHRKKNTEDAITFTIIKELN